MDPANATLLAESQKDGLAKLLSISLANRIAR
jgi:hypothetical protein